MVRAVLFLLYHFLLRTRIKVLRMVKTAGVLDLQTRHVITMAFMKACDLLGVTDVALDPNLLLVDGILVILLLRVDVRSQTMTMIETRQVEIVMIVVDQLEAAAVMTIANVVLHDGVTAQLHQDHMATVRNGSAMMLQLAKAISKVILRHSELEYYSNII